MKRIEIILGIVLVVSVSCTNETDSVEKKENTGELDTALFLSEMSSLDSIMLGGSPEKKDIKKAIVMYQDYADYFPNDPKSPAYLLQVSDFYLSIGKVEKSVNLLTTIIEKYPDYNKIETVILREPVMLI